MVKFCCTPNRKVPEKTSVILFAVICCFVSCGTRGEKISFTDFEHEYELKAEYAGIEENYRYSIIHPYDSLYILTNNPMDTHQIHLYDENFEYLISSGITGKGPGEIINPFWAALDDKNGIIWFLDMGRREFLKYPVDHIINDPGFIPSESIPLPDDVSMIVDYKPHGKDLFSFADIDSDDVLISFFNNEGKIIESLTRSEELDNLIDINETYPPVPTYIYEKHPVKDLYVVAYRFSDIIAIIDREGNVIASVQGPDMINQVPDGSNDRQKRTYSFIRCNENYIFAHYLGGYQLDEDMNYFYPKYIHVFDWEANPVARLILDDQLSSFTIDNKEMRIMGFSHTRGDILFYYLPDESPLNLSQSKE